MKLLIRLVVMAKIAQSVSGAEFSLRDGALWLGDRRVLDTVPANFTLAKSAEGAGVFLKFTAMQRGSSIQSPVGSIVGMRRFTSCHRDEPFWMVPCAGTNAAAVSLETQWLLAETEAGDCVMLVPLMDGPFVFTLSGSVDGLQITGETDDPKVQGRGGVALFVAVGNDPYKMIEAGARAVMKHLGTGQLRRDKPVPDFANEFGWCTWDSFYRKVSADGVRRGLESFKAGGVEPRMMILDDGWQDYKKEATGEERLISFAANQARFGGDLRPTVRMSKKEFRIRTFLVWHAIMGYWGGVDGEAMPGYDVTDRPRSFSPAILQMRPSMNTQYWGHIVGVVPPRRIGQFYEDLHERLEAAGVDGVKVDNQSTMEGLAQGLGGRVVLTRAYRAALEKSVAEHFGGRLINCMANAMETYYCSPRSTLMRTSIDFWPKRPETHGLHLYTNAQVGMWFGEFMQPDWDMFQSAHAMGSFHAAGRAVSGGPVYVSDTPDAHNFDVLRKLVLSDGSILRADRPGRPTRDCLFTDVTREPVLLKVFNYNRDCAVIGAFNCNYHAAKAERATIAGTVSPSDAPELKGDDFVGFAQRSGRLWRCGRDERAPLSLGEGEWEMISYAPVERGVAVIGLADKLNSTGAIVAKKWRRDGTLAVTLRDGGVFLAWSEKPVGEVLVDGNPVKFQYETATGRLTVEIPTGGKRQVSFKAAVG
ncbi:MAG TPA: Sip1-related alpha-galactosidase [Verrucomicrobiae bacterium]|nr:Sip1-related alpha-galactosidase [Verrucomicrobiae bacterium]